MMISYNIWEHYFVLFNTGCGNYEVCSSVGHFLSGTSFMTACNHITSDVYILGHRYSYDINFITNKNECEIHSKVIVSQDYFDYWVRV